MLMSMTESMSSVNVVVPSLLFLLLLFATMILPRAATTTTATATATATTPTVIVLAVTATALTIGYLVGSFSTYTSIWTSILISLSRSFVTFLFNGIVDRVIHAILVPLYTVGVVSYLFIQRQQYNKRCAITTSAPSASATGTPSDTTNTKKKKKKKERKTGHLFSSVPSLRSSSGSFSTVTTTTTATTTPMTIHENSTSTSSSTSASVLLVPPKKKQKQKQKQTSKKQKQTPRIKPIDMTGSYKVISNYNFDEFLKVQGVPWFLCNAACKTRPIHTFTHPDATTLTITIRGIIESETTYQIQGQEHQQQQAEEEMMGTDTDNNTDESDCKTYNETTIRGRTFRDTVTYLYEENHDNDNNNDNDNDNGHNDIPTTTCNTTTTTTTISNSSGDSDVTTTPTRATTFDNNHNEQTNGTTRRCVGIQTHKIAVGQGYTIYVNRRIIRAGEIFDDTTATAASMNRNNEGQNHNQEQKDYIRKSYQLHSSCDYDRLLMTNTVIFEDTAKEMVQATQLFLRL